MKMYKNLLVILFCVQGSLYGQQNPQTNSAVNEKNQITEGSSVLFTIAKNDILVSEFERQFLKNLNIKEKPITSADIDEYLKLYIRFKMKIQDALDAGKDTILAYKQELAMYRDQLSRNYLYDRRVTQKLIDEAFERMRFEVKVSHILISCPRNANKETEGKAEKRIKEIQGALKRDPSKENFATFAKTDSDDPGTKFNGGQLGYLTALQVVYEFENEAYNTPVGSISGVFRTDFGFHILRVDDKRENLGDVRVRHILLRTGPNSNNTNEEAEKKINEIVSKINTNAESFDVMARTHSEDFSSKYNGGLIDWLNTTQFVGDVERQEWIGRALALPKDGDITTPFKTSFGWHILQRVAVRPLGNYDQLKVMLKNKVQQNQRSQISVDSLVEKIKSEEGYKLNQTMYSRLMELLIQDSTVRLGKFNTASIPEKITIKEGKNIKEFKFLTAELFNFAGESYTVETFSNLIQSNTKPISNTSEEFLKLEFNSWVRNVCVSYQNQHLEEKSTEFRDIYNEYRDGILMFNRMQEVVWDKANTDSVGLTDYFKNHQIEYQWNDRFYVEFYFSSSEKMMKTVFKQVKKGISADTLKKIHTKKSQLDFDYRIGKYQLSDTFLFPQQTVLTKLFSDPIYRKKQTGVYKMGQIGSDFVIVKVKEFLPAGPKKLEETRGPVASKYQSQLESMWISSLENKYPVKISQEELLKLKKKLNAN